MDDDQPRRTVDNGRDTVSVLLRKLRGTMQNVGGISCDARVVLADPFAGIARAAEGEAPDLRAIGPHRRQALRNLFVGTRAARTIRSSLAWPVLMVNAPPVGAYRHVMLTTDMPEGAAHAVKTCAALDVARGARASILHDFDAPALHLAMSHAMPADERQASLEDQRKEASQALSAFVTSVDWRSIRQDVRQVRAMPAEEILAAASEGSADLVVAGTHGRSGLARFFLGSVAEAVRRRADRDVLAVPPAAAA